jgi:hypothetical protein
MKLLEPIDLVNTGQQQLAFLEVKYLLQIVVVQIFGGDPTGNRFAWIGPLVPPLS